MNNKRSFNRKIYKLFLSLSALTLLLFGCSKNGDTSSPYTGDLVSLSVLIEGVKSPEMASSLRASIGNKIGLELPKKRNITTVHHDDVFIDIISEEEDLPSNIDGNSSIKNKLKYAATVPMANGTKYRLLLYNATTNVFYTSKEAIAGEAQTIAVVPGQAYQWYAYSYNTNSQIPIPSNLNNPTITTPTTTTLLYASGTITASNDGTPLPITFEHQLTQLRIEVKEGIRAILSSVGTFDQSDYVKTSSFNLKNGTKGALSSAGITTLNFSNLLYKDTIMRVAQYYTADDLLTSYNVNISSIGVQYTSTTQRTLSSELPNSGNTTFSFPTLPTSKKGYILKGALKISFVIPKMKIQTFSNSNVDNAYRLGPNTNAYNFLMDPRNFGMDATSRIKSKSFEITPPTGANLAASSNAGRDRFNALLNTPANYPDILIFANYHDYASFGGHELMDNYLRAGGAIFYTHDDASLEDSDKGGPGLALILDNPGALLQKHSEDYTVYSFTNTTQAQNDATILKGPFGDVSPYYWGQDRIGTSYVTGITNPNVIIYSNQPVNHAPNTFTNQACFLRHKTKNFFFVGDGGFFIGRPAYNTSLTREPFRTNANNVPVLAAFGNSYGGFPSGHWQIANSFVFGNAIAYMMDRVHYYGINRTQPIGAITPDPVIPDEPDNPDEPANP